MVLNIPPFKVELLDFFLCSINKIECPNQEKLSSFLGLEKYTKGVKRALKFMAGAGTTQIFQCPQDSPVIT